MKASNGTGIVLALGLGSELRSYQRCEFERRDASKRTTQLNWAQLDGMDEFVTLRALTGRAYVKELIRSNGDAQAQAQAQAQTRLRPMQQKI